MHHGRNFTKWTSRTCFCVSCGKLKVPMGNGQRQQVNLIISSHRVSQSKIWLKSHLPEELKRWSQITNLHPPSPFLSLVAIKIEYGLPRKCWFLLVLLKWSNCRCYDEKNVQKQKQVAVVVLSTKMGQRSPCKKRRTIDMTMESLRL